MGKVIHLLLTSLDSNMFSVKQTEADRTDLLEGYLKTLYQLRQYDWILVQNEASSLNYTTKNLLGLGFIVPFILSRECL